MGRIAYFLFFLSVFLGPYLYLGIEKLHLVRLLPLSIIVVLVFSKIRISLLAFQLLAFYFIYLAYTVCISLAHLSYIKVGDIINLIFLLLLVVAIVLLIEQDKKVFIERLTVFCKFFIIISICVVAYEVVSKQHLRLSGMANTARPDFHYYHIPTAFYTNANDFCFIFILAVMFLIYRLEAGIQVYLLIGISIIVIYLTEARLALLGFAGYLFFHFKFLRPKTILYCGLAALLMFFLLQFFKNDFSLGGLSFEVSSGGSISRRYHLYLAGLKSAFYNFGSGFGVGGYHYYYGVIASSAELHNDTDPHNFFIELLINSGVVITLTFVIINAAILFAMVKYQTDKDILLQFVVYNFLLLSSSSSLFLWPHYIFYFVYVLIPNSKKMELG